MHFVYILESEDQTHWYIGMTNDIERKFIEHNSAKNPYTSKYDNWNIKTYIAFNNYNQALKFEKYLKSHSGRAFSKKRL